MSNINLNLTNSQVKTLKKIEQILTLGGTYKLSGIDHNNGGIYKVAIENKAGHHMHCHIHITKRGKATGLTLPSWVADTAKSELLNSYGLHTSSRVDYEDYWYRTL